MSELFRQEFLGNTLGRWALAAVVGLAVMVGLRIALRVTIGRIKKLAGRTKIDWDDVVVAGIENTKWFSYLAAGLYAATQLVRLPERLLDRVDRVAGVLLLLQLGFWTHAAIVARVKRWKERAAGTPERATAASALGFIAKLAVWATLLLAVLSTLGVKITALVAGLGVGGVAAALAVQTLLGDVIASLSIYFDRPFDIGQFIVTPDGAGTVQRISMRSTRLRAIDGEELIFANGELLKKPIRNFGRMQERRVVFEIGVEYATPGDQLRMLPELIAEIVRRTPDTRLDRVHFKEFGAYALIFEVVLYVLSPDYNLYMDRRQTINFAIFECLEGIGVAMAFPTQTLHVQQSASPAPRSLSPKVG